MTDKKCCICQKGFTKEEWDERHDMHEGQCPQSFCDCDHVAHDKCCTDKECNNGNE